MSQRKPIVVINPNSTEAVTEAMDRALDPLRLAGGPGIVSVTNPNGPPGIECQGHVDDVSADVRALVRAHDAEASAFVIACYSDPGMHAAREATTKPVFGIAESGMLTAMSLGERVGIIAILSRSVPRHLRYIRAMGVETRLAGDRAIELGVVELSDEARAFERMVKVGGELRDQDGADVLVLGCAGMARYRERLAERLGIPVVDPTQAAVGMAITAVYLGQTNARPITAAAPASQAAE
ncbi:MAG: aspartate/glutamate racemase family protein [Alphaproteobacteria bacterium]|nr:aspartate/glutamate racemase family protein [Alphaproteobacteria bacterium]